MLHVVHEHVGTVAGLIEVLQQSLGLLNFVLSSHDDDALILKARRGGVQVDVEEVVGLGGGDRLDQLIGLHIVGLKHVGSANETRIRAIAKAVGLGDGPVQLLDAILDLVDLVRRADEH